MNKKLHTQPQTNKLPSKPGVISERDVLIIDTYYNNGYNKSKAVKEIIPSINHSSQACNIFNALIKKKECIKYLDDKRIRLSAATDITNEQVLNELKQWAYSDATDFISLTENEIKELPPEVRRTIQSFKATERKEKDRSGNEITTKAIEIKLINKADALKEISKHIGFYEIDHKQKQPLLNLSNATPDELNIILKLLTDQKQSKETKTIDV